MLPNWLRVLSFSDRDVVFDDRTGRHVVYPAGTAAERIHTDQRLISAGMLAALEPARLFLYRTRQPLFLAQRRAFLVPNPSEHPPGGHLWRLFHVEQLGMGALALWHAADGRRTVAQLADSLGHPVRALLTMMAKLTKFDVQMLVARPDKIALDHLALCRVVSPPRQPNTRTPTMYADNSTALGPFHEQLADATTRFDHAETTLAHALARPHTALGGVPFGARLAEVLLARFRGKRPLSVAEVGGGTGELGAAFVATAAAHGRPLDYLRIDRSPGLLAAQERVNVGTRGMLGDALALPLADGSVDLLVANEVIADLPSERTEHGWKNTGAEQFVRECARVLKPRGTAYVSEFGSLDDEPEETEQLDHPEVSIRFSALARLAEGLGMKAEVFSISQFLSIDLDARWLWRPHLAAVRAVDALHDRPPTQARAWSPETLDLAEPVEGLRWVSMREEGPGPLPARMFALVLTR